MPETAVNEDQSTMFREHEIRTPMQLPVLQAVPEPASMKSVPDQQLGLCVPVPDRRHVAAAGLPVVYVSQFRASAPAQASEPASGGGLQHAAA